MNKAAALALFESAESSGAWEDAARALASVIRPARRPAARNRRQGPASKAFPSLRLPAFKRQACGHTFNSAGCAVCQQCQRAKPAPTFTPTFDADAFRQGVAALCGEPLLVGDFDERSLGYARRREAA